MASIYAKGKSRYLGGYVDFEAAVAARRKAEEELYGQAAGDAGNAGTVKRRSRRTGYGRERRYMSDVRRWTVSHEQ